MYPSYAIHPKFGRPFFENSSSEFQSVLNPPGTPRMSRFYFESLGYPCAQKGIGILRKDIVWISFRAGNPSILFAKIRLMEISEKSEPAPRPLFRLPHGWGSVIGPSVDLGFTFATSGSMMLRSHVFCSALLTGTHSLLLPTY